MTCVSFAARREEDTIVRLRAIETLSIILRYILAKNLAGWEVMVIFAGEINESDKVFMVNCDQLYKETESLTICPRRSLLI